MFAKDPPMQLQPQPYPRQEQSRGVVFVAIFPNLKACTFQGSGQWQAYDLFASTVGKRSPLFGMQATSLGLLAVSEACKVDRAYGAAEVLGYSGSRSGFWVQGLWSSASGGVGEPIRGLLTVGSPFKYEDVGQ